MNQDVIIQNVVPGSPNVVPDVDVVDVALSEALDVPVPLDPNCLGATLDRNNRLRKTMRSRKSMKSLISAKSHENQ